MLFVKSAIIPKTYKHSTELLSTNGVQQIGAVVVGGCYQGLGIVRSLGRRGVPVCIIDDELSLIHI